MIRMSMLAGVLLLGTACSGTKLDETERTQMSEDMAQTEGDEDATQMADAEEGDPLLPPDSVGGAEMDTEPGPQ